MEDKTREEPRGAEAPKWRELDEPGLRDAKAPWPESLDELRELVEDLAERQHDYGTCVYAMSIAATAAYYYVAKRLGVTGFQASCADMDILRRTRGMERFHIRDLAGLLYPQHRDKFAGWEQLIEENKGWLAKEAAKNLEETPTAHPNVLAHWKRLAAQEVRHEG